MDYKTLTQTVDAMNEEQLYLAEKKIHEERRKRDVTRSGFASAPSSGQIQIVLSGLVNAVRENLRQDLSICSESTLASVLDHTRKFCDQCGDETVITQLLLESSCLWMTRKASG